MLLMDSKYELTYAIECNVSNSFSKSLYTFSIASLRKYLFKV